MERVPRWIAGPHLLAPMCCPACERCRCRCPPIRARAVALECLRRIGEPGGTQDADIRAEIHRAFRDETGMTLTRWRYAARMRIARGLLTGDAPPSAVARRTGYAHLPTFSAAFSRFHGLSPREYQEREAARSQ